MEKTFILVVPLLGIVLIGYLLVRFGWLSQAASDGVARFATSVAVPMLVFHTLATSSMPKNLGNIFELLGSFYGGALATFALAMLVARFAFHAGASEQGNYGTAASHSNAVLLGLPAIILILGAKWTTLMILVASHDLILAVLVTTVTAVARRQTAKLGQNLRQDLVTQGKNPIFVALILGLIVNPFDVSMPGPLNQIMALISAAAVPCALFAAGGILARLPIGGFTPQNGTICALKLVAFPVIVWILAKYVASMPASWTWMAVMLATMPIGFDFQTKGRGKGADNATTGLSSLLGAAALIALTYIIVS